MIINESRINEDWSGYLVRFSYDGDELSDYTSTCIVKASSESEAINKAKPVIAKSFSNPYKFTIDGKINSYDQYKKDKPYSNYKVII